MIRGKCPVCRKEYAMSYMRDHLHDRHGFTYKDTNEVIKNIKPFKKQ